MIKSISKRYDNLLRRRAPAEDRLFIKFAEAYERESGEYTKYIIGACRPVDSKYTQRLSEQGDRVENQLQKRITDRYPAIEFRRQGSVSNNTHIKYYSDIDVLTIIDKFIELQHPQIPRYRYNGIPEDDLLILRRTCLAELSAAFPKATIDDSGATSISISGASLACKVDVVPSNWLNTNSYATSNLEYTRGIMVLNKREMTRKQNYPFLFNQRLGDLDSSKVGIPRMLIRLLKTIKADANDDGLKIDFSSFDICSIVYRMPSGFYVYDLKTPLSMFRALILWLECVISDSSLQNSLLVIDESRKIFNDSSKNSEFRKLYEEAVELYNGALKEHHYTYVSEALIA